VNTWESWADGKAWANPKLSAKIHKEALPLLKFQQFVDIPDDFGPSMGSEYYYAIEQALSPGPITLASNQLAETGDIPLDDWNHLRRSITVQEWGRGASWTKKHAILSKWSIDSKTRGKLKDHYVQVMDLGAATALRATNTYYIPTGVAAGTYGNDGSPGAAATANLTLWHLEEIHDYLSDTLKVEPWDADGSYMAILNGKAWRSLFRDSTVEEVQKYADALGRMNGELGRLAGFRIIHTNNTTSLPNVAAGCGGGLFFGKDAVTHPVVVPPTLLSENTGRFGRFLRVAWWGLWGWGITWTYTTDGGSRVIRLAST